MQMQGLDDALRRVRNVADTAGFDDSIADFACQIFENAFEEGAIERVQERDVDGKFSGEDEVFPPATYSAAVYAAARVNDVPTKPSEVAKANDFEVEADTVADHYRRMLNALPFTVEPEDPKDWVGRVCDRLDVRDGFREYAFALCDDAVRQNLHSGKSVSGFAASVVYAAAVLEDRSIDQGDVADAADVSPVTIRNQYPDIADIHGGSNATRKGDKDAVREAIDDAIDAVGNVPDVVHEDAIEMAGALPDDVDWVRRTDPRGLAAGLVYIAAKANRVDVSQTELADATGVHKGTVINRVKDLREWRTRSALEDKAYNDLKRLAAEEGVDVGDTPEREYLIDRLVQAGVEA